MSDGKPSSVNAGEREFEVGKDEAWFANIKQTYDVQQNLVVNALKQATQELAQTNAQTAAHTANVNGLALQAMQNAIETANAVSKQAVRHADIAIDHQWNVDEQAVATTIVTKVLAEMAKAGGSGK